MSFLQICTECVAGLNVGALVQLSSTPPRLLVVIFRFVGAAGTATGALVLSDIT